MTPYLCANRNARLHACFTDALPVIWDGKSPLWPGGRCRTICDAIGRVQAPYEWRREAQQLVMDRLGGYNTVSYWLFKHEYLDGAALRPYKWQAQYEDGGEVAALIQEFRVRWLKALIEEFAP